MPNGLSWERFRERFAGLANAAGRDPLIPVAAGAVGGIMLGDMIPIPPYWIGGATLLALILGLRFRFPGRFVLAAVLAFAFAQSVTTWKIRQFPFHTNLRDGESIRIRAEGIVVNSPTLLGTGNARRCLVEINQFAVAGQTWRCRHRLPVTLAMSPRNLDYGQRIGFSGVLSPLDTRRSPGAFAPDLFYYRSAGATGEIRVQTGDATQILEKNAGNPLIAVALRSRARIASAITRGLDDNPEMASVIKAMVLGSREDTPEEIEEQFRLSGAMHVFAVSGLHVGIFGAILWWILRWLRVPKRWAVLIIIPAILFYAVVTGLRPSAVRAAVMGTVILAGFVAERKPRLLNSLAFAALLILAIDPQQLFLPGFQLSFAVLTSIALFADPLKVLFQRPFRLDPLIPRRLIPRWRRGCDWGIEKLSTGLGVSIAAWIGSAILIAHYFQILTPVAVIANLLMVPLAFLVLAIATISALLSLTGLGFLSVLLNQANAVVAQFTTFAAASFASIPGGHLHVSTATLAKQPACQITVLESSSGGITGLVSVRPNRFRSTHWLIDPGNPGGFTSRVQPLLRHYGINRFQAIVLSHGDYRHVGATGMALRRFPTGALLESPLPNRSLGYRDMAAGIDRDRTLQTVIGRGDWVPIDEPTSVEILFPPRDFPPQSEADDQCLVLRLNHHGWKVLFTFDSGFLTAKWLEENRSDLRADIWIKGWHGGDHQGFVEFLERIQPDVILTTNRDFPAGQRIPESQHEVLNQRGIKVFDMTASGAVTLEFSKETLTVTPFIPRPDLPSNGRIELEAVSSGGRR